VRDASRHGLEPEMYLTPAVAAALDGLPVRGDARVARDAATTLAALRYMRDLHLGRVDPRTLGLRLPVWDEPHDFARFLAASVNAGRPLEAIDGLAPPYVVYGLLVEALATYRTLATRPLPVLSRPKASLHPGDDDAVVPAVVARLAAFGDLDPAALPPSAGNRYDSVLAEGVARFQTRHGLTADGVLGARTLAALSVTPSARASQIAIALERLRWLPDLGTRRVVAVNIPMFELWAWDADRDLALLKTGRGGLPLLEWGPENVRSNSAGTRLYAMSGSGGQGATASPGLAIDQNKAGVRHNAPLSAEFRGGPLVNAKGQVIAVVSLNYRPTGIDVGDIPYAPSIVLACEKVLSCPSSITATTQAPRKPGG